MTDKVFCVTCGEEAGKPGHKCDAQRLVAEYPQLVALIDEARRESFARAIREVEKEARWQIELMMRDPKEKWGHSVQRLNVVAASIRQIGGLT